MNNLVAEANVSEGTFIHREMTKEELAQDEIIRLENEKKQKAEELLQSEIAIAKAALLEKLGITEEEAKLLFS
jgi:hypothetical protein